MVTPSQAGVPGGAVPTQYSCPSCGAILSGRTAPACPQCHVRFGGGVKESTEQDRLRRAKEWRRSRPEAVRARRKRRDAAEKIGIGLFLVAAVGGGAAVGGWAIPAVWPGASMPLAWVSGGLGAGAVLAFVVWILVTLIDPSWSAALVAGDHERAEKLRLEGEIRVRKGLWLAGLLVAGLVFGFTVMPAMFGREHLPAIGLLGGACGLAVWLLVKNHVAVGLQKNLAQLRDVDRLRFPPRPPPTREELEALLATLPPEEQEAARRILLP